MHVTLRLCVPLPPCVCARSHPGVSVAVFVSLFACGFVAMRGECIVGLPGSVVSALAYGAVSLCCFCVPSSLCLLSGLASFVSSPSLVFGGISLFALPCEFASYSIFLRIISLTNVPRFWGGKLPFPLHGKSFLQNNNTLT